MKNKILFRFLLRRFFSGCALVLLIVCGIIFAVTFVERLPSNPTMIAALNDAWTRLIEYIPLFLPLAIFMGTLVASYNLTRSSESVIISGAGLSPFQIARPFLIGAFIIGALATTVLNPYAVQLSSKNITEAKLKLVDNKIWLREASDTGFVTLVAKSMHQNNQDLIFNDSVIYVQSPDFKLTDRIDAASVRLSENGLDTKSAHIFDKDGKIKDTNWHRDTLIKPQTVLERYLQPNQISFWKLPGFIKQMAKIGVTVRGHLVQFWTLLFLPLTMIAMATLGVAFSQTKQRRNHSFGTKFALGILTCFVLYFITNLFSSLGANGTLPPLLAIIAPPLIIIAASGVFISGFDSI